MSNIRGLYDDKKDESSDDEKDSNNRYVGGIGARGGGRLVLINQSKTSRAKQIAPKHSA
eukprot:jgi/Psemu1/315224/fgenesh1_kg.1959_\